VQRILRTTITLGLALGFTLAGSGFASAADCVPSTGCVPKENGVGAWWADSISKGQCAGQSDQDWKVFYRTDNSYWLRADINKIRFGAADWSKVNWPWPIGATQAQADDIQPPGITLCFGSHFSEDDLKGTYVRLQP